MRQLAQLSLTLRLALKYPPPMDHRSPGEEKQAGDDDWPFNDSFNNASGGKHDEQGIGSAWVQSTEVGP